MQEAKSLFLRLITVIDALQFQNYDYLECLVRLSPIIQQKQLPDYRKFPYFMLSDKYCLRIVQLGVQNVIRMRLTLFLPRYFGFVPKSNVTLVKMKFYGAPNSTKAQGFLSFFPLALFLPKCTTSQFLEFHPDPKIKDKPHNEISALIYLFLSHCDEHSVPFPTNDHHRFITVMSKIMTSYDVI